MNVMALLMACRRIPVILAIFIFFVPPVFSSQNLAPVCTLFQGKQGGDFGALQAYGLFPESQSDGIENGIDLRPGAGKRSFCIHLEFSSEPIRPLSGTIQFSFPPLLSLAFGPASSRPAPVLPDSSLISWG